MRKLLLAAVLSLASVLVMAGNIDSIIPCPAHVQPQSGSVEFRKCRMSFRSVPSDVKAVYKAFSRQLVEVSGGGKAVPVSVTMDGDVPSEGYRLSVADGRVDISASDYNGFYYALVTLEQLLPESIFGSCTDVDADWTLPCCEIDDAPRFAWRGALLDSARHFFSVEEVRKFIDAMALCKMNRFHWHLTDDHGWRIQIDAYPRLTEVGAWRKGSQIGMDKTSCDNIRHGGWYSKQELKDIVAYAAVRGIEVVPEIDMPGHMMSALASYPELGCKGGPYEVSTKWGVHKDVLCPGKENTFTFLETVLSEVTEIFPSEYYHIGGDECPKNVWKECADCQALISRLGLPDEDHLQTWMMNRIMDFLATKGKKVVGWDEILKGSPAEGTVVMNWRNEGQGVEAVNRGYDIIVTPSYYLYLDHGQSMTYNQMPLSASGERTHRFIPFSKAYGFDPLMGIPSDKTEKVVGVQLSLWTERISANDHLEYMMMPRAFGISELQWSPASTRDAARMDKAVREHGYRILDAMGFCYCRTME